MNTSNGTFADWGLPGLRLMEGALTDSEIAKLRAEIDALDQLAFSKLWSHDAGRVGDELIVVAEASDSAEVCRYEFLLGMSPLLRAMSEKVFMPLAAEMLGGAATPFKDKLNRKPPNAGAFRPHQDFAAYRHFPPRQVATVMVAIDAMTPQNGCVNFATDYLDLSARRPDLIRDWVDQRPLFLFATGGPHNGDILHEIVEALSWKAAPLSVGGVAVFDGFIPHRSEINASGNVRRTLFITYNLACEGDWYQHYYCQKRKDPLNPIFHVSTPTAFRE